MSDIIASPFGHGLSYPPLFFIPTKSAALRRPANHFWEKAIAPPAPAPAAPDMNNVLTTVESTSSWLDDDSPPMSDNEDANVTGRPTPRPPTKKKSFARMRQIAYQVFVPKSGSNKSSTVVATEIVAKKKISSNDALPKDGHGSGLTMYNSWRIKTKGANTKVRKLAAVVRHRVSSKSPEDQKPKTWEEYHRLYAAEQININDPPLPPTEFSETEPTPFQNKCYMPPNADDESSRQLVINRLGVFGKANFSSSEDAVAQSKKRTELAEKLEEEGQAPQTLEKAWEHSSPAISHVVNPDAGLAMIEGRNSAEIVPETLEQHPVFRNIVRKCREMFGATISMLSIMDAGRQIFLAESGLDGLREAPRVVTVCAHTVLSGRKGFTILDTLNDWRFSSSPLVTAYGARFYAGVPLMAPNLDGSPESDQAACPIGTLCVLDVKPRDSFGVEERKKLVYMAEYARREIEVWFRSKMIQKMAALEDSHQTLIQEIQDVASEEEELSGQQAEVLTEPELVQSRPRTQSGFRRFTSSRSLLTLGSSTPSPVSESAKKPTTPQGDSLFDGESPAVKPKMRKVFEMVSKLVADTLDLSLVYLLAVTPNGGPSNAGRTLVLSGHNLLSPVPSFDAELHLRALRAPEGGSLYQNPSPQEILEAALMPMSAAGSDPYASAMFVRVGPAPTGNEGGFVMAGFTSDAMRVFGAEDFSYMQQFANELTRYTLKLRL